MHISNINFSDDSSGASIAVKRINQMLNKKGFTSEILVYSKKNGAKTVKALKKKSIASDKLKYYFSQLFRKILKIFFKINFKYSVNFNLFPSSLAKILNNLNTDIINLHWLGSEMISISDIGKIKKDVVWTLHDMWPYTCFENYIDEEEYFKKYTLGFELYNMFPDYFIPEYIMVSFTNIPYSTIKKRSYIQDMILKEILSYDKLPEKEMLARIIKQKITKLKDEKNS